MMWEVVTSLNIQVRFVGESVDYVGGGNKFKYSG